MLAPLLCYNVCMDLTSIPIISDIGISEEIEMMTSDGSLMFGHLITFIFSDKEKFICTVNKNDLQNLFFLLNKVLTT